MALNKAKKTAIIVSSAAVLLGGVLNVLALGVFDHLITERLFGYEVDSSQQAQNREEGEALAEKIVADGVVLLKNDAYKNKSEQLSLPLSKENTPKVNVFGWASTEWVPGGSGSGRVVSTNANGSMKNLKPDTGLLEALKNYDIEYNEDLSKFYENFAAGRPKLDNGTLGSWNYEYYRLIEPKLDSYSDDLLEGASEFSDTAIVVIGRVAGESSDAPKAQYKGTGTSASPSDATRTYLEISTEEEELLEYVGSTYDNVIVVVNSINTMELGFLDTIEGLDSCLLVGGTGINAANALPKLIYGEIAPSGKLTDTYAYEFESNPSYANAGGEGENIYTNSDRTMYPYDGTGYGNVGNSSAKYPGVSYVDYAEGIYIGYKWYETAYAEGYFDDVSTDYGDGYEGVVQYPFGYGLSYSEGFDWEIIGLSHQNNAILAAEDKIEVTVRVTNTGTVKAKDVVQLYYNPPYIEGEIEKSAMNLAAFAKTPELEPGKYADVKLSFTVEDMASYDCYDMNSNNITGYELDPGKYEVKLMRDAHNAHEIKVSNYSVHDQSVINYSIADEIHYENYKGSSVEVTNKFTGEDAVDGAPIDGSSRDGDKNPITYLTRSDFEGTFPEHEAPRAITNEQLEYNLYTQDHANAWRDEQNELYETGITLKANKDMKVYENGKITELGLELGADYDNEKWDDVLGQMTATEMQNLVLHGYCQTREVNSIGKPKLVDLDGPAQMGSFNANKAGTGYPNATVLGQTWSHSLAYDYGLAMGKEAKTLSIDGWYGPGMNLHRSPFGGRNYEYYSEDAYLSGIMGANSVRGAKNAGVYSYLKHLAVYDQEEYRDGLYTWLTEQAFREIYLKPFHMTVVEGGATGIMTSYNRVGACWAGGSTGLLTDVVKNEWNFRGTILTDYADHHSFMSMDHALRAGGDLWMDGYMNNGAFKYERNVETASKAFQHAMKRACKNIIYTGLNALYTNHAYNEELKNNPNADKEVIEVGSKGELNESWKTWVIVVDAVVVLSLGAWVVLTFLKKETAANA